MKKRIAALVMVVGFMLATAAPTFAQGVGGSDPNPGQSEGSSAPIGTPPQDRPGTSIRDPIANEAEPRTGTGSGFGRRVEEQQG